MDSTEPKKEDATLILPRSSAAVSQRSEGIFLPIKRPFLKSIPDPSQANAFLKAFAKYSEEVAHRRSNREGEPASELMQFCLHPDLVEYLVECEGLEQDENTHVVSDEQIRNWLETILVVEDHRPLAEIMKSLKWRPGQEPGTTNQDLSDGSSNHAA